jgi:hypothetical protein
VWGGGEEGVMGRRVVRQAGQLRTWFTTHKNCLQAWGAEGKGSGGGSGLSYTEPLRPLLAELITSRG